MAQYKSKEDILSASLGDYAGLGFRLNEPDDDILELLYLGKVIALYNQARVTIPIIREGCQNYLDNVVTRKEYN